MTDLASCTREYVNKVTGEIAEDPPDEVLEILAAENAKKTPRRQPLYEPTPHRFARFRPLGAIKEVNQFVGDECCCCNGAGIVENLGVCPLCDGKGSFDSDDGQSDPNTPISPACSSFPIEKVDLLHGYWGYDDSCFLLRNLLTPSECQEIIHQAEGFGLEPCAYSSRMRITDRVCVIGEELGKLLFNRAKPYLPDMHISMELPMLPAGLPQGIPMRGAKRHWSATELNPCFRVCRYEPGGFFQPHHDGGFEYNSEHRSFKTFMLYLNDDFEGGSTNFYKESQKHYHSPDPAKVIHELRPERGSCLVFNHCITHDGGILRKGRKYILRTEVMYQLSH